MPKRKGRINEELNFKNLFSSSHNVMTSNAFYSVTCPGWRGMCAQPCPTFWVLMDRSPPSTSCLWNFPGKNTGVGSHFLLQGIFLTQRSNSHPLHLLHWQADSLPPCHEGRHSFIKQTIKDASSQPVGKQDLRDLKRM